MNNRKFNKCCECRMLLLYFLLPLGALGLLCSDILEKPEESIVSVEDLKSLNDDEIDKCVAHLGKVKIPMENAEIIWESLIKHYGAVGLVPDEKLHVLHWISIAIKPEHYKNMTLSSIDAIENFGLYYNLSSAQLAAIVERVKEDWGGKKPEDYTSYDLMALRQILCAFKPSDIMRIHSAAYKDAATALGTLKKCPNEILKEFATLAMEEDAFGKPAKWKESTIKTLGVVMDGLPRDALRSISRDIIKKTKWRVNRQPN